MGAWKYCDKCEGPLNCATFRDILHGVQVCPHCLNEAEIDEYDTQERAMAADDLMERIEAIEQKLGIVPE